MATFDSAAFEEFLGVPPLLNDPKLDWDEFGRDFNVDLPDDYRRFVSAYGPGCIGETLLMFHPRGADDDDSLSLPQEVHQASAAYSQLKLQFPDMYPLPIYPEPSGCFPIARTSSGDHLFLKAGPGDSYSVVAYFRGPWVTWDMSFCEFLLGAVSGRLDPPFFHESVLEDMGFEPCGSLV